MTDVAATPVDTGTAAPALALESYTDAAVGCLETLRVDRAFGAKRLAKDAEAVNLHSTLMQIAHGGHDAAMNAQLAESIGLKPRATLAAAEKARAAAEAASEATRVELPYQLTSKLTPQEAVDLRSHMSTWAANLNLPQSTTRLILDRVASQGPSLAKMSPEAHQAWIDKQNAMIDKVAGSKEVADQWRAAARKLFDTTSFNHTSAPVLHDAFIVANLATAAGLRK
jgi:hypothetical protein